MPRTDELLDEWERVIVREHARTPANAAAVTSAIREWFADSRIDPATYRDAISSMPGPDPDDHVHCAAAVAAGVDALLTSDQHGFPAEELAELGVRVIDPDTYLCGCSSTGQTRLPRRWSNSQQRRTVHRCCRATSPKPSNVQD